MLRYACCDDVCGRHDEREKVAIVCCLFVDPPGSATAASPAIGQHFYVVQGIHCSSGFRAGG